MRARRLAGLGLAVAGVGYGLWLPNLAAFSALETALTVVQALALFVAAGSLAVPEGARARGAFAGALVVGAGARVGSYALGPFGDLTALNGLFASAGWVLAAWFALLLATEAAPRPSRLGGLRMGLLTVALGNALWIPYNVLGSTYEWMPGNLLLLLGTLLAVRALGDVTVQPAAEPPEAATGAGDPSVRPE